MASLPGSLHLPEPQNPIDMTEPSQANRTPFVPIPEQVPNSRIPAKIRFKPHLFREIDIILIKNVENQAAKVMPATLKHRREWLEDVEACHVDLDGF